ncbi:ferlin [Anopheles sinensis]|uniref:Ferlin n=1 Tax=Anopheles sinensis TaxID=74873 RepID=A0A084W2Z2_ANOSI|nr:ferlin [Anopheles sinensis]
MNMFIRCIRAGSDEAHLISRSADGSAVLLWRHIESIKRSAKRSTHLFADQQPARFAGTRSKALQAVPRKFLSCRRPRPGPGSSPALPAIRFNVFGSPAVVERKK